ncbi:MAG TPA: squalene--hopene cyclase [Blastocatellia bacterium]
MYAKLSSHLPDRIRAAADCIWRGQSYLLSLQDPEEGYWWAELEANVTLTAEYIMLHRILGTDNSREIQKATQYLLDYQIENGSWELYYGDGGDLSTSVEAYFALKLAGWPEDSEEMVRAAEFILDHGGVSRCRVFTKIHLALFGALDWAGTPTLPAWFMLLPSWFPFNIYDMASWARSSMVPFIVVLDKKPQFCTDLGVNVDELYVEGRADARLALPDDGTVVSRLFLAADSLFKLCESSGLVPFRRLAIERAERWIIERQEPSGDWAGIIPAMLNSLLALHCLGYSSEHPLMKRGLEAMERFGIDEGGTFHIQPCVSPVWDTALAVIALIDSGVPADSKPITKTSDWLLSKQIMRYGDWAVKNRRGKPGGWAFEFDNDNYPDVDDSAAVICALLRVEPRTPACEEAINAGIEWILSMQSKNGGWGAFDVNNTKDILNRIPYGDLKAMIDPPTADLTGRVLEMLGRTKYKADPSVISRAIKFLREVQEPDGCWYGRWGVNYLYGTSLVLGGLRHIGYDMTEPWITRSAGWIRSVQNPDGGWGESCETYKKPWLKGRGPSTPSQTAWALTALMEVDDYESESVTRGVEYLVIQQNRDGSWAEPQFTGTGFPGHFFINYHLYRNTFPLTALGRYFARHSD